MQEGAALAGLPPPATAHTSRPARQPQLQLNQAKLPSRYGLSSATADQPTPPPPSPKPVHHSASPLEQLVQRVGALAQVLHRVGQVVLLAHHGHRHARQVGCRTGARGCRAALSRGAGLGGLGSSRQGNEFLQPGVQCGKQLQHQGTRRWHARTGTDARVQHGCLNARVGADLRDGRQAMQSIGHRQWTKECATQWSAPKAIQCPGALHPQPSTPCSCLAPFPLSPRRRTSRMASAASMPAMEELNR